MSHLQQPASQRFLKTIVVFTILLLVTRFVPAEAAAQRKVIVFLQGMCTTLDNGTGVENGTFDFLRNMVRLQFPAYTNNDFMLYSYAGGYMKQEGGLWKWHHNAYPDYLPMALDIRASIFELHNQLRLYREKNPEATFILVGHSLGGVIAWEEMVRRVTESNYPVGMISKIITIDSPILGAPPAYWTGKGILARIVKPCSYGSTLNYLTQGYKNVHNQKPIFKFMFQGVVDLAAERGVQLVTIGNTEDGVFRPVACITTSLPTLIGDGSVQWLDFLEITGVDRREFTKSRWGSLSCIPASHSAILQSTDSVGQIVDIIGPQY